MPSIPQFIKTNSKRDEHLKRIRALKAAISAKSKALFGVEADVLLSPELEFVGVLPEGTTAPSFKTDAEERIIFPSGSGEVTPFDNSSYVMKVVKETVVSGATEKTPAGEEAKQIEIVGRYKTPRRMRSEKASSRSEGNAIQMALVPSRHISPEEVARSLEIVPQLITHQAGEYGFKRMDFGTIGFAGERDQPSSLQMNCNLADKNGHNLFDDGTGKASKLHLCFVLKSLEFDRDATILYAPTPQSFQRFGSFCGPKAHFLCAQREEHKMGSMMIRGPQYHTSRNDEDREHKKIDAGGVRLEHRLASPEAITLNPQEQPYILIESYLLKMLEALKEFETRKINGSLNELTEESLKELRYPFPSGVSQARSLFLKSNYMKKLYGDSRQAVLDAIPEQITSIAIK